MTTTATTTTTNGGPGAAGVSKSKTFTDLIVDYGRMQYELGTTLGRPEHDAERIAARQKRDAAHQALERALCTLVKDENDEADARLIAAAPELYEALKAVCEAYGCECVDVASPGHCAMCGGRAVLAKVEGELSRSRRGL